MKDLEMQNGARRLVEINAGLKPEERALIVCDTDHIDIAGALAYAVKSCGAELSVAIMEPRSTHGEDPTEAIARAMLGADVIFAPTKYSLSHAKAREEANRNGARFISMPDYTREMMKGGAIEADFLQIHQTVKQMKQLLTEAKEIRVTTPAGTDISLRTEGRIGNEVSGVCREAGTWGSPPNIEVNVSPIENLTRGTVVVDGSIPMPEIGLITEELKLVIQDGRIAAFIGKGQADAFRALINGEKEPENLVLAEFGIGLNNKAHLCGSMLEDEGTYGTAHFGFGHNADQGGKNRAGKHIDAVFRDPTVEMDGRIVMKDGILKI